MTTAEPTAIATCCQQINQGRWCQESYETATGDSRIRARQLRKVGYVVSVYSMGPQVTPVGTVKLTMVDIRPGANADTFGLPEVNVVRWR